MTVAERINERSIGVIGMGRSGLAAASLAAAYGGLPFVSDAAGADSLSEVTAQLKQEGIPFETGGHTDRLLQSDYVVVSPGVPPTADILKKLQSKGIPVFSEIEFASWVCRGKIIGVTGSNGKTTTTTLIGEILTAAGLDSLVCGNIGLPFAQVADKIGPDSVAVVEVSTFQLERIADFNPHIALILNLSPDHLDRHGSFDAYKKLKYRITENQTENDFLILNAQDNEIIADNVQTAATKMFFTTEETTDNAVWVSGGDLFLALSGRGSRVVSARDIRIPGPHNLQNAAAAVAVAGLIGVDVEVMARVLKKFPGVEHRLESVARVAGIDFINDSKATNV
ncbi:MAG: UDP-N-acetylmuramoyl-L-alanine--D-glutamate ligase, partial [candidate division Zixibacteria bacterium]|nr:UDP-N-acetylmuramoyl-L-alanine--D-glutamate ligase [candidate division Zixibacteria bacterium]